MSFIKLDKSNVVRKGGEGSGNFGHAGRPGEVGGSGEGGGGSRPDAAMRRLWVSPSMARVLRQSGFTANSPEQWIDNAGSSITFAPGGQWMFFNTQSLEQVVNLGHHTLENFLINRYSAPL